MMNMRSKANLKKKYLIDSIKLIYTKNESTIFMY